MSCVAPCTKWSHGLYIVHYVMSAPQDTHIQTNTHTLFMLFPPTICIEYQHEHDEVVLTYATRNALYPLTLLNMFLYCEWICEL